MANVHILIGGVELHIHIGIVAVGLSLGHSLEGALEFAAQVSIFDPFVGHITVPSGDCEVWWGPARPTT